MAQKSLIASPGRIAEVDQLGYLVTIDIEHHKIHEGSHWNAADYDDDVDTGSKYWLVRAPADGPLWHLIFQISSSRHGLMEAFWNPTINADGNPVPFINNNFNIIGGATLLCFADPTAGSDGNRFFVRSMGDDVVGASKGSADKVARTDEFILKPTKEYLFKFTAIDDNTRVSIEFDVYS